MTLGEDVSVGVRGCHCNTLSNHPYRIRSICRYLSILLVILHCLARSASSLLGDKMTMYDVDGEGEAINKG